MTRNPSVPAHVLRSIEEDEGATIRSALTGPHPRRSRVMTTTAAASSQKKIGPGTRFNAVYADSKPTWEVTRSRGRGVFEAKVVDSPDYDGVTKVFTATEVAQAVAWGNFWEKSANQHGAYYANLQIGSIVHYCNGFNSYVRCVAVIGTTLDNKTPHTVLRPTALVGDWHAFDLPSRRPDGSVSNGHYVQMIAKGECFEPNYSNVYEVQVQTKPVDPRTKDPRNLPAIDLSLPPMTPEEEATANLWRAVQSAEKALSNRDATDPRARLQAALEIAQKALA